MNEWQTVQAYELLIEQSDRLGFGMDKKVGEYPIAITALSAPYLNKVDVFRCSTFDQALAWLQGYSQRVFEDQGT